MAEPIKYSCEAWTPHRAKVFTKIALVTAACGIVLLLLSPWMKKMMQGIK